MCSARDSAALPAPGLPHSGIRGSKAVKRLTAAYRSRPRPSSTPGAKASTVCPYYLDGDQKADAGWHPLSVSRNARSRRTHRGFPVSLALAVRFSRVAERRGRGLRPMRSLKTQQRTPAGGVERGKRRARRHRRTRQAPPPTTSQDTASAAPATSSQALVRSTFLGPGRIPDRARLPGRKSLERR
jgi:hypothetical protein